MVKSVKNQELAYKLVWIACKKTSNYTDLSPTSSFYLRLEVDIEVRDVLLDQGVQLVHAQPQLGHAGLEHLPHPVVLHDLHKDGEGVLFRHLE